MRQRVLFLCIFLVSQSCLCTKWDAFSVKTLYEWSHSDTRVDDDQDIRTGTCNIIHVSGVLRHGARNPSLKDMLAIEELVIKIINNTDQVGIVSPQKRKFDKAMGSELVLKGANEHIGLGYRFGQRFHKFLEANSNYLKFVSSSKSRAKDSFKYFNSGFSRRINSNINHDIEINDKTMRFYDGCKNYEKEFKDNKEFEMFQKTPEFIEVKGEIEARLGLNTSLLPNEIFLLYEMCAYDEFIFNGANKWCQFLTDGEREVLEYGRDVEKYYESSYGLDINSKMVCPLMQDIFFTMENALDAWENSNLTNATLSSDYVAAKFQFGHWVTVLPLMTALGLSKDELPLLADNMAAMKNRTFKTSDISPSSANVVFALYACADSITNATELLRREYVVKLFVNEVSVSIPACGSEVCSYETMRKFYNSNIEACNIMDICDIGVKTPAEKDDADPVSDAITCCRNNAPVLLLSVMVNFLIAFSQFKHV